MGSVSLTISEYNQLLRKADIVDNLVGIDPGWREEEPVVAINLELLRPQIEEALTQTKFKDTHAIPDKPLYTAFTDCRLSPRTSPETNLCEEDNEDGR